jgi:small GTP-binding protein
MSVPFKVILLGNAGVGKTTLVRKYQRIACDTTYVPTAALDFSRCEIRVRGVRHHFGIWDTGGQEQFRAVVPFYVRDASAGLILFDMAHRPSFDDINQWIDFFRRERPDSFILVFGNKLDLPNRTVTALEAAAFCEEKGFAYMEGSAKTGVGLTKAFDRIAEECVDAAASDQRSRRTVVDDIAPPRRRCC